MDPLVDAGPAVEVAAEGNYRVTSEVQADVAVKAAGDSLGLCCCSRDGFPFMGEAFLEGHGSYPAIKFSLTLEPGETRKR